MADLLDVSLRDFLDTLAREGPAPGGGTAAAVTVAMAAAIVAAVARASKEHWVEAGGTAGQAEALRARVAPLAQADAEAYQAALTALRGREDMEERYRDQQLRAALDRAAEVPLKIAEAGTDVALLAATLTEQGNPEVRADASTAAMLAEGATRVAAKLVAVNLGAAVGDERLTRAEKLVAAAADAASRGLAAAQ